MVDVSIVMPCLNERRSLGHCISTARRALDLLQSRCGLTGEIIIADNGSTDGSQELACGLGARVVAVARSGYGAAVCGGFDAAEGRYLVMGDADGSYDFLEAVPMVEALMRGADICMGSRFQGDIKPGAMPWKNRYIGNPISDRNSQSSVPFRYRRRSLRPARLDQTMLRIFAARWGWHGIRQ